MKNTVKHLLVLFSALLVTISVCGQQSTFDVNDEGWTTVNAAGSPTPIYASTGGNPGGRIRAADPFSAAALVFPYFNAPSKLLGNHCSSYGLNLKFDIQQSGPRSYVDRANVILSNGTITIEYHPSAQVYPAIEPAWSSYSVPLIEGSEWINSATGAIVTKTEMQAVLCNLTMLRIRARYGAGSEGVGGLDNVLIEKPTITFTTQPSPTAVCEGTNASFTASATGDTNLQYQWQIDKSGFVNLANDATYSGVTSGTLSISKAPASLNGTVYRVIVRGDASTATPSSSATLTVHPTPLQPVISSSITPSNNTVAICSDAVTLTAPAGFSSYLWSNGVMTQAISVSQGGSYTVQVTDANGCTSTLSDAINIVIVSSLCNDAPVIVRDTVTALVQGEVSLDLTQIISDPDNNLDFSSLRVVTQPSSGATAQIVNNTLVINYKGTSFSGRDRLLIEVCDVQGSCSQEEIMIDVVGDIIVYDAVSPNGDGLNDYFFLEYIEIFEATRQNRVSIFNRWGDIVYRASNYDNDKVKFAGLNNNGKELPSGTYFYKIEFFSTPKRGDKTGYLSLKR